MANGLILSDDRRNFIADNWKEMDDYNMGKYLDLSKGSVTMLRVKMGLVRRVIIDVPVKTKAYIIECFFNDIPLKQVSKTTKISYHKVSEIIHNNCFFIKRSYNTVTLVMDSKANY